MVFLQDIKARSVYWVLFPVLILLETGLRLRQGSSFAEIFELTFINWSFLGLQLLIVSGYFSLKRREWINITQGLLGWGDILFLFSISVYLSVLNFLVFYIASLLTVLFLWLGYQSSADRKGKEIPLAGIQALLLAALSGICWVTGIIDITDDYWLLKLLNK